MKIEINKKLKTAYLLIQEIEARKRVGVVFETIRVTSDINIDFDKQGKLFGLEILDLNLIDLSRFEPEEIIYPDEGSVTPRLQRLNQA